MPLRRPLLFFIYFGGMPFVGTGVFGLSPEQLGLNFEVATLSYFAKISILGRYSDRLVVDAMVISGLTFNVSGTAFSLIVSTSGSG